MGAQYSKAERLEGSMLLEQLKNGDRLPATEVGVCSCVHVRVFRLLLAAVSAHWRAPLVIDRVRGVPQALQQKPRLVFYTQPNEKLTPLHCAASELLVFEPTTPVCQTWGFESCDTGPFYVSLLTP